MQPDLDPLAHTASRLRSFAAMFMVYLYTGILSLVVVARSLVGKLDRTTVDRYTRDWSRRLLNLVGLRLKVHGRVPDFTDGRAYMILCSHASHFDIPVSFAALPGSIRMLAKQELYSIPLFGSALRAAEFPSVDRHNRRRAIKDLQAAKRMMESGIVLWAAPEGTRSLDGQLLPFKKGCFHLAINTSAIIIPVAINGIHHVMPAKTWRLNLGQRVDFHIGEPIDAAGFNRGQIDSLIGQVREQMLSMLGRPTPLG